MSVCVGCGGNLDDRTPSCVNCRKRHHRRDFLARRGSSLLDRAESVRRLLTDDPSVDPALALSWVVWPPERAA